MANNLLWQSSELPQGLRSQILNKAAKKPASEFEGRSQQRKNIFYKGLMWYLTTYVEDQWLNRGVFEDGGWGNSLDAIDGGHSIVDEYNDSEIHT